MRKPVVPRFLFLSAVFALVFIVLVQLQFAKKTSFTRRIGDLVIQGYYGKSLSLPLPNNYPLEGAVSVFFGGMEFRLGEAGESVLEGNGGKSSARLKAMTLADNGVYFELAEGPELSFITQYTGGAVELVIRADFDSDGPETPYDSIVFPFKPLRTSRIRENASLVIQAGGINYSFNRAAAEGGPAGPADSLRLDSRAPSISYRVLPGRQTVNPEHFIVSAARNPAGYETALALWLDQSYLGWNRSAALGAPGELVSAYMSEALKRGSYRAAAAAVLPSYNPAFSSYEASAYAARLDGALRGLAAAERERSARIARLLNERSMDFLREYRIIEYLAVRSYNSLMDDAAEILRTFDPAGINAGEAAGFLEGKLDWENSRPGRNNPYDRFIDQAVFVITEGLVKNPVTGFSLVFTGDEADMELNLRLGSALVRYSDENRIALGRTLILSVLSLADSSGAVPRTAVRNSGGIFTAKDGALVTSSRIYRLCFAGKNYARAQALGGGLWAWTAASQVRAATLAGTVTIEVQFSPGETHYMLIRGVKPFTRLAINGTAVSPDPQFERYDASGWNYSAPEQTLLLKLRHRSPAEHITYE